MALCKKIFISVSDTDRAWFEQYHKNETVFVVDN